MKPTCDCMMKVAQSERYGFSDNPDHVIWNNEAEVAWVWEGDSDYGIRLPIRACCFCGLPYKEEKE